MSFTITSSTSTSRSDQVDEGIELAELFGSSPLPQQVNTDTTLPTTILPLAVYTRSLASDHRLPNVRIRLSNTNKLAVVPGEKKTWFSYVIEYAPVESLALMVEFLVAAKWAT
jgi:hypothetical protein